MEVIDSTRLLGTIITNNLSLDANVAEMVRKSNARMELNPRNPDYILQRQTLGWGGGFPPPPSTVFGQFFLYHP